MAAQILPFPKPAAGLASPLACFVRVGEAHNRLADLHAAGHFPARQVVIEASRLRHQRELVSALRESGAEIVLDTEAAELAAPAKFAGHSHHAPWALPEVRWGRLTLETLHRARTWPAKLPGSQSLTVSTLCSRPHISLATRRASTGSLLTPRPVVHSAQRWTGRAEVAS